MPYIYRVSRKLPARASSLVSVAAEPVVAEPEAAEPEVPYRDLQAQAKALDIPANQSAEDLKKAIEEAESNG